MKYTIYILQEFVSGFTEREREREIPRAREIDQEGESESLFK